MGVLNPDVPEEGTVILIGIDNEADLYIEKMDASALRRILINEGFQHVPLCDHYGITNREEAERVDGLEQMRKLIETGDVSAIYSIRIL